MYMLVEERDDYMKCFGGSWFFDSIKQLEREYKDTVLSELVGSDYTLKAYKCEPFENKIEAEITKQRDDARKVREKNRKNVLAMICKEDVKRLVKAFKDVGCNYGLEIGDIIDEVENEIYNEQI